MLLILGLLFALVGVGTFLLTAFAAGMSDAPGSAGQFWRMQTPALILMACAVSCFIARHYIGGHALQW